MLDMTILQLHQAMTKLDANNARRLASAIGRVDIKFTSKRTNEFHYLIHAACQSPALKNVLQILINRGANVQVRDSQGRYPLHWAAQKNNLEAIQLLLDAGGYANAVDHFNVKPSDLCAPDSEAIKLLRQHETSLFNLAALQLAACESNDFLKQLPECILQAQRKTVAFHAEQKKEQLINKTTHIPQQRQEFIDALKQLSL